MSIEIPSIDAIQVRVIKELCGRLSIITLRGATEINDVRVSPSKVELELSDAGAQEGSLTFYSSQSLLAADSENCKLSSVENLGEDLWRVNVAGRQWGKPQLIRLQVKVVNDAARQ